MYYRCVQVCYMCVLVCYSCFQVCYRCIKLCFQVCSGASRYVTSLVQMCLHVTRAFWSFTGVFRYITSVFRGFTDVISCVQVWARPSWAAPPARRLLPPEDDQQQESPGGSEEQQECQDSSQPSSSPLSGRGGTGSSPASCWSTDRRPRPLSQGMKGADMKVTDWLKEVTSLLAKKTKQHVHVIKVRGWHCRWSHLLETELLAPPPADTKHSCYTPVTHQNQTEPAHRNSHPHPCSIMQLGGTCRRNHQRCDRQTRAQKTEWPKIKEKKKKTQRLDSSSLL